MSERVLCIPTAAFNQIGSFQGFTTHVAKYLDVLLAPEHLSFQPRDAVEEDPNFKQLIPYVLLRCGQRWFTYRRAGSEKRLTGLLSLGVGGHISETDAIAGMSPREWYSAGMRRELAEEVTIDSSRSTSRRVGLINDDSTLVNSVHLGVVHIIDLQHPEVTPKDKEIEAAAFMRPYDLGQCLDRLETWSQIAFANVVNPVAPVPIV